MNICILGSGISGLTAAHHLSGEPGLSITVLEQAPHFGGRANVTTDGEHCPRFFLEDYAYLFRILKEVPFGDGYVYDSFRPARRFALTTSGRWVEINHLYASMSKELSLRDKRAISKANRTSLLVAKKSSLTTNKFGSSSNYSARALLRTVGNLRTSRKSYVLPGCTDRYLVAPWVEHLRSRGVDFRQDCRVERLRVVDDGVEVDVGPATERFDLVLVTALAQAAYDLLDRSGIARPLDCRGHTHCKAFTVDLDPREPILADPSPRVYSNAGLTTVVQPDESRCVTLSTVSVSTEEAYVLDHLRDNLRLEHEPLEVRSRDNLDPGEAVFIGDYVDPVVLGKGLEPKVYFAGSYTANSYPVDSAEAACRSAYCALQRMSAAHPAIGNRWPATATGAGRNGDSGDLPAPSMGPSPATAADGTDPNSPVSPLRSRALWRLVCRVSAITGAPVARISFLDLSDAEWPLDRPAVYVANHRSIFDVVAGLLTFRRLGVHPRLVVAERFFKGVPGKALRAVGALPALRGSDATINAAMAAIQAGDSVGFMVEGKINARDHSASAGHGRGAPTVAVATGAPIVPIASWGTDRPWPEPRPWPLVRARRPKVSVVIGNPIEGGDSSPDELAEQIRSALAELEQVASRHAGDVAGAPGSTR